MRQMRVEQSCDEVTQEISWYPHPLYVCAFFFNGFLAIVVRANFSNLPITLPIIGSTVYCAFRAELTKSRKTKMINFKLFLWLVACGLWLVA